jgi:hypothetical protein
MISRSFCVMILLETLADFTLMKMCGGNNRINLYEVQFPSPGSQKNPDALDEVSAAQIVEAQELKRRKEKRAVEFHCKRFGNVLC